MIPTSTFPVTFITSSFRFFSYDGVDDRFGRPIIFSDVSLMACCKSSDSISCWNRFISSCCLSLFSRTWDWILSSSPSRPLWRSSSFATVRRYSSFFTLLLISSRKICTSKCSLSRRFSFNYWNFSTLLLRSTYNSTILSVFLLSPIIISALIILCYVLNMSSTFCSLILVAISFSKSRIFQRVLCCSSDVFSSKYLTFSVSSN